MKRRTTASNLGTESAKKRATNQNRVVDRNNGYVAFTYIRIPDLCSIEEFFDTDTTPDNCIPDFETIEELQPQLPIYTSCVDNLKVDLVHRNYIIVLVDHSRW